jgi:tetratricopeptide (TPR) repeat protein
MKRNLVRIVLAVAALSALFAVSRGVEGLSQRKYRLEVLYLPSGQFVSQAALGYRDLTADLLWFRMVQYYGGYRFGENDLALFNHLAGVITDLDPQFTFAYIFAALIVAEDLGRVDQGIAILEKGARANPAEWRFPFEIGFLSYVYARDYTKAVSFFERAAKLPGAGPQAARFAAFAAGKAGYTETSIALWEELARTTDNHYLRELAERYIERLKAGTFPGTVKK